MLEREESEVLVRVEAVNYGSRCGTVVEWWCAVKDCRLVAVPGAAMTLKGRRGREMPSPAIATGGLTDPCSGYEIPIVKGVPATPILALNAPNSLHMCDML
jgi:hypothetical protein